MKCIPSVARHSRRLVRLVPRSKRLARQDASPPRRDAASLFIRTAATAAALALISPVTAAPADLDTSFDAGTNADSAVRSVAVQADGRVVFATSTAVKRLNVDGSPDATFSTPVISTGTAGILKVALQTDGRILVAGGFSKVDGESRRGVARLNHDGSLDATFNMPIASGDVYGLSLRPKGKIVVIGRFFRATDIALVQVARLLADGAFDSDFDSGNSFSAPPESLAVDSQERVVLGGRFQSVNGTDRRRIARLNANGSLDSTFAANLPLSTPAVQVTIQDDDRILVVTAGDHVMRRLNVDGSSDSSFRLYFPFLAGSGHVVYVRADGQIAITLTTVSTFDFKTRSSVVLVPPTGGAMSGGLTELIQGTVENASGGPDGSVVVGGDFEVIEITGMPVRRNLARFHAVPLDPAITIHPVSQTISLGGRLKLSVRATGTPTLKYQWFKNGQEIPGATTAESVVESVTRDDGGEYRARVSNLTGSALSQRTRVRVLGNVRMTAQVLSNMELRLVPVRNSGAPMSFAEVQALRVQASTDLLDWSDIPGEVSGTDSAATIVIQNNGTSQRFFRVLDP